MARKFGKRYEIGKNFWNYSYIFNGVAGVGKTTMAYEMGVAATGSDEGTFIVTCGKEPVPEHIIGAFGDKAATFKEFKEINADLVENKADYPDTKFVCWDSLDELFRIAEAYVVAEYNKALKDEYNSTPPSANKKAPKYAKSVAQTYGGYQKGETRVVDMVINEYGKLVDAGYHMILLGHTKQKTKQDLLTGISYEQIGCNLDNKYYNALKDKVNIVGTAYFDTEIEDVKEETNAFTKKKEKKGNATSQKRMCIFVDDNMAVDTKTHLAEITPKVAFNANDITKAVQDAIAAKISKAGQPVVTKPTATSKPEPVVEKVVEEPEIADESEDIAEETVEDESDDIFDEEVDDIETLREAVKAAISDCDDATVKNNVKTFIKANGGKISQLDETACNKALEMLS